MNCLCFSLNSSQSGARRRNSTLAFSRPFCILPLPLGTMIIIFQISLFHFVMCIYQFLRIVCLESGSRLSGPLPLWSCRQSQGFQPPSFWLRCTDPLSPGAPPCTPSPDSCPGTAPSLDFWQGRAPFQAPFLGRVPSLADVVAEVAWGHGPPNPLKKKKI